MSVGSDRVQVSIGGYGPSYEIDGDGDTLTYRATDNPWDKEPDTNELLISPTREQWNRFWSKLDAIGVWEWPANCGQDPNTADGTGWSLEILHEGRTVSAFGINMYPPTPQREPTREFKRCCRAVSALAGGHTFQ